MSFQFSYSWYRFMFGAAMIKAIRESGTIHNGVVIYILFFEFTFISKTPHAIIDFSEVDFPNLPDKWEEAGEESKSETMR